MNFLEHFFWTFCISVYFFFVLYSFCFIAYRLWWSLAYYVLNPFLSIVLHAYSKYVKSTFLLILTPVLRFSKSVYNTYISPYAQPTINLLHKVYIMLVLFVQKAITTVYMVAASTLTTYRKYLYASSKVTTTIFYLFTIMVTTLVIFSSTESTVLNFKNYCCVVVNPLLTELVITQRALISVYSIILLCILFQTVYTVFNKFCFNIKLWQWWLSVVIVTIIVLPQITTYVSISTRHILLLILVQNILIKNWHTPIITQMPSQIIKKLYALFIHTAQKIITVLTLSYNTCIRWTPIFKKTSYFGLYRSFRNKWPF